MIDLIVDTLISQFNTQIGPDSSAENKLGLVTNISLTATSPNKTLCVIEGPVTPEIFEVGMLQPITWIYGPIELQLLCKGTEKEAKETRRLFISLIRQTIYNSTTRAALLALTNTVGTEIERVLKYNITHIRTDFAALKGQFIFIAVFQLSITTEISITS